MQIKELNTNQKNAAVSIVDAYISETQKKIDTFSKLLQSCNSISFENSDDFAKKIYEHEDYLNENLTNGLLIAELSSFRNDLNSGSYNYMLLVAISMNYEKMIDSINYQVSRMKATIQAHLDGSVQFSTEQLKQFDSQLEIETKRLNRISVMVTKLNNIYFDIEKAIKENK